MAIESPWGSRSYQVTQRVRRSVYSCNYYRGRITRSMTSKLLCGPPGLFGKKTPRKLQTDRGESSALEEPRHKPARTRLCVSWGSSSLDCPRRRKAGIDSLPPCLLPCFVLLRQSCPAKFSPRSEPHDSTLASLMLRRLNWAVSRRSGGVSSRSRTVEHVRETCTGRAEDDSAAWVGWAVRPCPRRGWVGG